MYPLPVRAFQVAAIPILRERRKQSENQES